MIQSRRRPRHFWLFTLTLLWLNITSLPVQAYDNEKFVGTVIFMRHALAPGTGDPKKFSISDCTTQRNLDDTGRAQARTIGAKMAAASIKFSAIYSSYWCRCLETARLLGMGAVIPFDGLNSFFQNHVPRDATLTKLRNKLKSLPPSAHATLMVTHFVTIRAITGLSVASGGLVIYDLKTGAARELALSTF